MTQPFNPLTPNIHIQILLTGLYTFPKRISKENLIKDKCIFPQVIILSILTMGIALATLSNENVDVPDVKNGNQKLIFSLFQCSDSGNSNSGS